MAIFPEGLSQQEKLERLSMIRPPQELSPKLQFKATPVTIATEIRSRVIERDDADRVVGGILHSNELDPKTDEPLDFIYIGNPFDPLTDVIKVPTEATAEQIEQIKAEILPFPESYELLVLIAHAYQSKQPLIIEGPTSIGKTFLIDKFAEIIHGPGAKPYDFYCTAQTDTSELTLKYIPNKYKLSEADPAFVLQYGALPKAMGVIEETDGSIIAPGDRPTGSILHIQEIGLAEPAIINVLLQLRGREGKMTDSIRLWDDGGTLVKPGEDFWLVMSTNPPEAGYVDRNIIDPALARGTLYIRLGELDTKSLQLAAHEYLKRGASENSFFDIAADPTIVALIGNVLGTFHESFRDLIKTGEKGRGQQIPATLADIARVAEYIRLNQAISPETGMVDLTQTVRQGVKLYYLRRLADHELVNQLEKGLEELLTGDLGKVQVGSKEMTFEALLAELVWENSLSFNERVEQLKSIFNQSQASIWQALEKEYADAQLVADAHLSKQLGVLATELSELKEETDFERLESIVAEVTALSREGDFGFNPDKLRSIQVHAMGSATSNPMSIAGVPFAISGNTIKIPKDQSSVEKIALTDLDISACRTDKTTVWAVAGDQQIYTYDTANSVLDSLGYCGKSSDYKAVSILPFESLVGAGGVAVGTKEGVLFIKDQPTDRFRSLIVSDPNMQIDLLEHGLEEGTMIIGEKNVKGRMPAIIQQDEGLITNLDLQLYTSVVVLKKHQQILVGHATPKGAISVFNANKLATDGSTSKRQTAVMTESIIGHSKGINHLAVDRGEKFVVFASQFAGIVGFMDAKTHSILDTKIEVPENITGLRITPEDELLITAGEKLYVYANALDI